MRLNLGCGRKKRFGWVNVDKDRVCDPDEIWDLEGTPWPWDDQSADAVAMIHVMEHLGPTPNEFFAIIKELYRVVRPGGLIEIAVPHPRSNGYIGDPTHVRPINDVMLRLFSKKANLEAANKGWPNTPLAFQLDVDFEIVTSEAVLGPEWKTRPSDEVMFAADHYWNVIEEIRITWKRV